jgi:hypothetical protein
MSTMPKSFVNAFGQPSTGHSSPIGNSTHYLDSTATRSRRIAEAWPNWDDDDERRDAVNNTFNNLIRYPHGRWDMWHDYISPTEVELRRVYARFSWRAVGPISQGYFDSLS